jgi:hypothetical protein
VLIDGTPEEQLLQVIVVSPPCFICCLAPTFGAHRGLSMKITLAMPPRGASQCLHPGKGLLQTTDQNISHQPPTQALPTITETSKDPANMSTAAGSSHNGGGASPTQTLGGASHQSPPRVPSPPQELDQVLVQDWDEEAEEDEATTEEEELIWVQQEIEDLQQE